MSVAMKSSNIIAISTSSWSTFRSPATRLLGSRRPYSERVVEQVERLVSGMRLRSAAGGRAPCSRLSASGGALLSATPVAASVTSTAPVAEEVSDACIASDFAGVVFCFPCPACLVQVLLGG